MGFGAKFNGGFVVPLKIDNAIISTNTKTDEYISHRIVDDNTTYRSKLFPNYEGCDTSTYIPDAMLVEVFYDQTTYTMPGAPGFIESPPDDYHPMPEIEYAEGPSALTIADRYVRTPHFVVKPDSTSQYYGKDRHDNYMATPFSSFNGKFNWYDGLGTKTTFNGGDLYATPNGLHMSFLYLRHAPDMTVYLADLYHSKYKDSDGTFAEPVLLEQNIDVAGYGMPTLNGIFGVPFVGGAINRRTNPKMFNVPNTGLFLSTLRSNYDTGKDTTEFHIDLKLSRDDGTNWSDFSKIPLNFYWTTRIGSSPRQGMINEWYCPYMHWAIAENKIIGLVEFRDARDSGTAEKEHINIIVSTDNAKTFNQFNIDFSQIFASISEYSDTAHNRYIVSTLYYDPKISKFVMLVGFTTSLITPNTTMYGFAVLANRDDSLREWDVVLTENLTNHKYFRNMPSKRHQIGWSMSSAWGFNGGEKYAWGHGPKIISTIDENGLTWAVFNGGMSYKGVANAGVLFRAFDDYADYSGFNSNFDSNHAWMPTNLLVPLEFVKSTDSYLNQLRYATGPWRARKFGTVTHKNRLDRGGSATNIDNNNTGIPPGQGASLSIYQDSIIQNFDGTLPKEDPFNSSAANGSPCQTFYIQSITKYKNDFWMLGTDTVLGDHQEQRRIEYQIPTIIHRPNWSNVNIKGRKIAYLTPTKHYDSTYVGWGGLTPVAGQQITTLMNNTGYYPNSAKEWQIRFFRNDAGAPGGFNCGLTHMTDSTFAFENQRGAMCDVDSTRGAFCHFIASKDYRFNKDDITNMIHSISIPSEVNGVANKTMLNTWLGKDFVAFSSSGGGAQHNQYSAFNADTSREMEFLVVSNRFRSIDTTHEHRAYMRYHGHSDWTFMYFNLCTTGTGFSTMGGIMLGNIYRWPTTLVASPTSDVTSVIFFKYHAEGWSALDMHRHYPANVSGVLTPSTDNKLAVLPQPCLPVKTFLPRGMQISWSGQDATANARFKIMPTKAKNSLDKMFDTRPNIGWRSVDGTTAPTINIDLGRTVSFNSVVLYNHNLFEARISYGQENSTTDMTSFLYFDQSILLNDATNFVNLVTFRDQFLSVVDKDALLNVDPDFLKFYKQHQGSLHGKVFSFLSDNLTYRLCKRLKYSELWNDSSVYMEFERPNDNLWTTATQNYDFGLMQVNVGNTFVILADRHLFKIRKKINARYLKIQVTGAFGGLVSQPNMDGYFKIGSIGLGNFEENENPIQHRMKTTILSPTILNSKMAGSKITTVVSQHKDRKRFEVQIQNAEVGSGKQFEQIENLFFGIGNNRDSFYFCPRELNDNDKGMIGVPLTYEIAYGYHKIATDVYLVRQVSPPSFQRRGNLANATLILEEVT